jgi:hypothetical protein
MKKDLCVLGFSKTKTPSHGHWCHVSCSLLCIGIGHCQLNALEVEVNLNKIHSSFTLN